MKSSTTSAQAAHQILQHRGLNYMDTETSDFSYASGNYATIGTYKVPLVHNLKRPPPTQQRMLLTKEHRVLDLLVQQTQPTKYRRTSGLNTTTPEANMRVNTHDINNHSHQPTARRLTWEDEWVPGPGLNLKIDGDQSFQTNCQRSRYRLPMVPS